MCGRFTLFADYNKIIERFNIEAAFLEEQYQQSYNIAPSQSVVSIINDGSINRLGYLRWGFIPSWSKDEKIGYKMINARAETVAEKPSFRQSFRSKRCLIIADSFYEWRKDEDKKIPMRIKLKSGELFAMAGIWEMWKDPTGNKVYTCSIITTKPNELVSSIHDRMPVILNRENEQGWLNPNNNDPKFLSQLLMPYDHDQMEAFEVSAEVNSTKNNSYDLIQEI